MTKPIEFLIDVGSPNAFLAYRVLREREVVVTYTPVLLGGIFKLTNNASPIVAFASIKGKLAYEMTEIDRFKARHGLGRFRMNPHFPINTVQVMRVIVAAQREGRLGPALAACMTAMWEAGANLGEADVLRGVLDEAGLDGAALFEAAGDQVVKDALRANTERAAERGAFGVPTFFVGEEMWFGKDRIDQVVEAAG